MPEDARRGEAQGGEAGLGCEGRPGEKSGPGAQAEQLQQSAAPLAEGTTAATEQGEAAAGGRLESVQAEAPAAAASGATHRRQL